jgi:hypothetical protein
MPHEYEIAGEEGSGLRIVGGKVVVGMGSLPGPQFELAAAEVQFQQVVDNFCRRNYLDAFHQYVANLPAIALQVEIATGGQRARQIVVADDSGADLAECRIAENMVGMHVRVDEVAEGFVGHRLYRR